MSDGEERRREPIFNAPWQALAIPGALILAYLVQANFLGDAQIVRWAFAPEDLEAGRFATLVTHQFLHSGLGHIAMNAGAALAFAPPVARYFGGSPVQVLVFFIFTLLCGASGALGYAALNWGDAQIVVGASGAISGLWGAASRLMAGPGILLPLNARPVVNLAIVFVVLNLAIGLFGGLGALRIAWEAHLGGYAAGLLLVGPAASLVRRR